MLFPTIGIYTSTVLFRYMAVDLQFLEIKTQNALEDLEGVRDVELADLAAAVFGGWSFVISLAFILLTGDMLGVLTGLLPSQFILLAGGVNVWRERYGVDGWEKMNQICLISGFWMMLASMTFQTHIIMQFSNTLAGMWIGLSSTYAAFLRQNDPNRETVLLFKRGVF